MFVGSGNSLGQSQLSVKMSLEGNKGCVASEKQSKD